MGLDKFSAALDLLKGFHVNLFVGENVYKGKLIGVETDHVVLETDNKYIFYYNIEKIQAITKNTKQFQPDISALSFKRTQSLKDLLHSFQNTWVTILAFNKQKFTGVLSDIDEDFITVINGEERILIKVEHVSNILKGVLKEEESKQNDAKENKNSSNKSNKSDDDKKDESEEDKDCHSCQDTEEKSKQKTKSSSNKSSEKKAKAAEKKHVEVDTEEKMVWSQPIKGETVVNQIKEVSHKNKKPHSEETTPKVVTETKKPQMEMAHTDKKMDESKSIKSNFDEPSKDMKTEKEVAPLFKLEPKPVPLLPMAKKEVKPIKSQETTPHTPKASMPQNASNKKVENTTHELNTNDTKSVWKQKDKETQAFRFTGEPVKRDEIKAFPFAGWPNRSKKTFRF
ncbi:hypothetical protein AA0X95_15825 [Bacillus sp. 1P10SD]|uniref:hypothetical protein n=1 Tax=Bacillus sp. 1P10SD TaxID=3132265 RepID=UPI0039A4FF87